MKKVNYHFFNDGTNKMYKMRPYDFGQSDEMSEMWMPYDFMAKVSNEIINKVRGVNRVCYDISSKPPSTIEWE